MTATMEVTVQDQLATAEQHVARLTKRVNYLRHRSNVTPHTGGDVADLAMFDWLLELAEGEHARLAELERVRIKIQRIRANG